MLRITRWTAIFLLALAGQAYAERPFEVDYLVEFLPSDGVAAVSITVKPGEGRVIALDFAMDPERYSDVRGDGSLKLQDGRAVWQPPRKGGSLQYRYRIDKQRRDSGYDARITEHWAIVRGDHLVPAARTRLTKDARSHARLRFKLPEGWNNVDTPYLRSEDGEAFVIENPERRFVRPVGWMIAGDIGTRREWLEGMEVSVAAPKGDSMRRNDILAFINILAEEMREAFGGLPPKLLIVGAGDPMWRGGLSGPNSMYLHADRPMINENGTSTLVHELVHVVSRIGGRDEDRWIGEGIAEFYSIELMRRTGLISERRAGLAFAWKERRGRDVKTLLAARSSGPRTSRAVTLFADLDREIRELSNEGRDLDDLVRRLMRLRRVDRHQLQAEFEALTGQPSRVLQEAPFG
jgi:predicted metalloprotease with PDZ domain